MLTTKVVPVNKIILSLLLPLFLLAPQAQADSLSDAFNYLVNTTAPGSYNSQIRGLMSAGSINVSFPTGTVTLISVTPPSFEQGCGGISMFLGGLAYINGQEFTQMLKNIASAALGYVFQLALRTLCPVCSTILADLQKAAQMASELAINQCQFAKGLVNKVADASGLNNYLQGEGAALNAQAGTGGSSFLSDFNNFGSDISKAFDSVNKFIDSLQSDSAKKQAKAEQPIGNDIWKAMPDADAVQKIFIMSLVGPTFVAPPSGDAKAHVTPSLPTINSKQLADLFVFGVKGKTNKNLTLRECKDPAMYNDASTFTKEYCSTKRAVITSSYWYTQAQAAKNKLIGGVNLADYGFYGAVYALLMQAVNNNKDQKPVGSQVDVTLPSNIYGSNIIVKASFSEAQIRAFLSTSPVPLYQAINLATWDADISRSLVSSISELVAAQYTLAFIEHMILDTSKVGNSKAGTIGGSPIAFHKIKEALDQIHANEIQIYSNVMHNFEMEQSWVSQLHSVQDVMIGEISKQGMSGNFALSAQLSGSGALQVKETKK